MRPPPPPQRGTHRPAVRLHAAHHPDRGVPLRRLRGPRRPVLAHHRGGRRLQPQRCVRPRPRARALTPRRLPQRAPLRRDVPPHPADVPPLALRAAQVALDHELRHHAVRPAGPGRRPVRETRGVAVPAAREPPRQPRQRLRGQPRVRGLLRAADAGEAGLIAIRAARDSLPFCILVPPPTGPSPDAGDPLDR